MAEDMQAASSTAGTANDTSKEDKPVQISIEGGDAFVWSAAGIARLRRQYGIVGLLTGSLPLIPQQNVFLGVPLQLFEEEVVYLMRQKAVVLVDDAAAHANLEANLSAEGLAQWHQQREAAIIDNKKQIYEMGQQSRAKWEQQAASSQKASERRKEREEKKRQQKQQQKRIVEEQNDDNLFAPDAVVTEQTEVRPSDDAQWQSLSHPITIPTSSEDLPWHHLRLGENAHDTLSSAARSGLWRYPENAEERARCAVFEGLRDKGYFMGKGLRFGGDFNVYPGDPLRYHSHFTATVQTTPESPLSAQELVAAGRLGTAVKKAHLLCSAQCGDPLEPLESIWRRRTQGADDDAKAGAWGSVDYYSLTWAGFGT